MLKSWARFHGFAAVLEVFGFAVWDPLVGPFARALHVRYVPTVSYQIPIQKSPSSLQRSMKRRWISTGSGPGQEQNSPKF